MDIEQPFVNLAEKLIWDFYNKQKQYIVAFYRNFTLIYI